MTDHFSGISRATGPECVFIWSVQKLWIEMTFDLDNWHATSSWR